MGASVVNLNTRLVAHELAYILGDSARIFWTAC